MQSTLNQMNQILSSIQTTFVRDFVAELIFGRKKSSNYFKTLHQKFEQQTLELLKGQDTHKLLPIAEVHDQLSPAEIYRDYVQPGRPVVLRGYAKDWPSVQNWTPKFFAEHWGDSEIIVNNGKTWKMDKDKTVDDPMHYEHESITLNEFIQRLENDQESYMRFFPIFQIAPELIKQLRLDWLWQYSSGRLKSKNKFISKVMFIGGKDTTTRTHCAVPSNFFVQIYGQKKWYLWEPKYTPLLYPIAKFTVNKASRVDFRSPDDELFPLYKYAPHYEVVLNPGDILWVPPSTWHAVVNLTQTVGLSLFWGNVSLAHKMYPLFLYTNILDPFTIKSLIINAIKGPDWSEKNLLEKLKKGNY